VKDERSGEGEGKEGGRKVKRVKTVSIYNIYIYLLLSTLSLPSYHTPIFVTYDPFPSVCV
jgi:hypothetical protein